jgi:hypothetical protein
MQRDSMVTRIGNGEDRHNDGSGEKSEAAC